MAKRYLVAALSALLLASPALAADESDVLGQWAVDTDALRGQMERMLEGRFDELPHDQRDAAMEMAKGQIDAMVRQMAAEAEFRPGGTVVFTSGNDPATYGTWSLEDDLLRFERDQPVPNEPSYVGTIEDGVIRVQPDGQDEAGGFTLTLRRIE